MDEPEPPRRPPEGKALARRAFFADLDGKLSAAGYAVHAPVMMGGSPIPPVAAPPPPVLSFEAWAELSLRFTDASPSRVGGETMGLDPAQQRPTPTLPFAGSNAGVAVGYVPPLSARQYVALSAELALQPAPREATLRRYHVPTEAALRALEEEWRAPARRVELESALAEFATVLRGRALG